MDERFKLLEDCAKLKALIEAHKAGKDTAGKSTSSSVPSWHPGPQPWHSHRFQRPPPHIARALFHGGRGSWRSNRPPFGPWAFRGPHAYGPRMHHPWMHGAAEPADEIQGQIISKTQSKTKTGSEKQTNLTTEKATHVAKSLLNVHKSRKPREQKGVSSSNVNVDKKSTDDGIVNSSGVPLADEPDGLVANKNIAKRKRVKSLIVPKTIKVAANSVANPAVEPFVSYKLADARKLSKHESQGARLRLKDVEKLEVTSPSHNLMVKSAGPHLHIKPRLKASSGTLLSSTAEPKMSRGSMVQACDVRVRVDGAAEVMSSESEDKRLPGESAGVMGKNKMPPRKGRNRAMFCLRADQSEHKNELLRRRLQEMESDKKQQIRPVSRAERLVRSEVHAPKKRLISLSQMGMANPEEKSPYQLPVTVLDSDGSSGNEAEFSDASKSETDVELGRKDTSNSEPFVIEPRSDSDIETNFGDEYSAVFRKPRSRRARLRCRSQQAAETVVPGLNAASFRRNAPSDSKQKQDLADVIPMMFKKKACDTVKQSTFLEPSAPEAAKGEFSRSSSSSSSSHDDVSGHSLISFRRGMRSSASSKVMYAQDRRLPGSYTESEDDQASDMELAADEALGWRARDANLLPLSPSYMCRRRRASHGLSSSSTETTAESLSKAFKEVINSCIVPNSESVVDAFSGPKVSSPVCIEVSDSSGDESCSVISQGSGNYSKKSPATVVDMTVDVSESTHLELESSPIPFESKDKSCNKMLMSYEPEPELVSMVETKSSGNYEDIVIKGSSSCPVKMLAEPYQRELSLPEKMESFVDFNVDSTAAKQESLPCELDTIPHGVKLKQLEYYEDTVVKKSSKSLAWMPSKFIPKSDFPVNEIMLQLSMDTDKEPAFFSRAASHSLPETGSPERPLVARPVSVCQRMESGGCYRSEVSYRCSETAGSSRSHGGRYSPSVADVICIDDDSNISMKEAVVDCVDGGHQSDKTLLDNEGVVKESLVGSGGVKIVSPSSGHSFASSDNNHLLEPELHPVADRASLVDPSNGMFDELLEWKKNENEHLMNFAEEFHDPNDCTIYQLSTDGKGQTNAKISTKRKSEDCDLEARYAKAIRTVLWDVGVGSMAELRELGRCIVCAHLETLGVPDSRGKAKLSIPAQVTVATQTDEILPECSAVVCQGTQTERLASPCVPVKKSGAKLAATAETRHAGGNPSCSVKHVAGSKPAAQTKVLGKCVNLKKTADVPSVSQTSEANVQNNKSTAACGRGIQNLRPTSPRAGMNLMPSSAPTRHFGHRKLVHARAQQQCVGGDLGQEWRDRLEAMLKKRADVEGELHKMFQQREQRRLARQAALLGYEESNFSDVEELPAEGRKLGADGQSSVSTAERHTCSKSCNLSCNLKKANRGISKLLQGQKKVAQLAQSAVSDLKRSEPQPSTSGMGKKKTESAEKSSVKCVKNPSAQSSSTVDSDSPQPSTSRPKLTRSLSDSSTAGSGTPATQRERLRKQFVKRALIMTQRCLHRKIIASLREADSRGPDQGDRQGRGRGRGRWRHHDWNEQGTPGWMRHSWGWHKHRAMWHIGNATSSPKGRGSPGHHFQNRYSMDTSYPGWMRWADRKGGYPEGGPFGRRPRRRGSDFSEQPFMMRRKVRATQRQNSNKMKIDNRDKSKHPSGKKSDKKWRPVFGKNRKLVMIGGTAYRANKMRLERVNTVGKRTRRRSSSQKSPRRRRSLTVGGVKYLLSGGGRKLRRISSSEAKKGSKQVNLGGVTYIQTRPGSLVRATGSGSSAQKVATRSVMRSIATAVNANRKRQSPQYCLFYNRFGKCRRGDKCPYIHDADKVAVCTRFLRGTCQVTNCPFSHQVAPDKMPVCTHYLRGSCSRDPCPYRHVNVSRDAEVCPGFLKGFCPNAEKCKKLHTLECPEFRASNTCSKGAACKMKHPRKRVPMIKLTAAMPIGERSPPGASGPSKILRLEATEPATIVDTDDPSLPWRERKLPSYISLSRSEEKDASASKTPSVVEPLQIRPNLQPPPKS